MSRNTLSSAATKFSKTAATFVAVVGMAILASCTKENLSGSPEPPRVAIVVGATTSSSSNENPRKRDFTESAPESAPAFAIRFERQACYGVCPVYVIEISESGLVHYNGTHYVKRRGKVTKQLSATEMDRLKKEFERVGFLSLSWKDPCAEMWTDNATVITTLIEGGRKRTIEHYHGNKCFPATLDELEKTIDEVVGSSEWTKCPRPDGYDYCDR